MAPGFRKANLMHEKSIIYQWRHFVTNYFMYEKVLFLFWWYDFVTRFVKDPDVIYT